MFVNCSWLGSSSSSQYWQFHANFRSSQAGWKLPVTGGSSNPCPHSMGSYRSVMRILKEEGPYRSLMWATFQTLFLLGFFLLFDSAGIGRTGVLITMETAMCLIECNQPVYPLDIVRTMRDQRAMMIQTPVSTVLRKSLHAFENVRISPGLMMFVCFLR